MAADEGQPVDRRSHPAHPGGRRARWADRHGCHRSRRVRGPRASRRRGAGPRLRRHGRLSRVPATGEQPRLVAHRRCRRAGPGQGDCGAGRPAVGQYDGERISAAFSERLRNQVDLSTVTADLSRQLSDRPWRPTTCRSGSAAKPDGPCGGPHARRGRSRRVVRGELAMIFEMLALPAATAGLAARLNPVPSHGDDPDGDRPVEEQRDKPGLAGDEIERA